MRTIKQPLLPQLTKSTEEKFIRHITKIIVLFFISVSFINETSAQQPACNITGPLRAKFNKGGGNNIPIQAEVYNTTLGTTYQWTLKKNTSKALIVSGHGTPTIDIKAGTARGNFTVVLTVTNPAQAGQAGYSCSCSKSVSVIER